MSTTQEVHVLFRGSAELAKYLRLGALGCELVAALIAIDELFLGFFGVILWRPVLALTLVAVAVFLREYSKEAERFAELCRSTSVRAFAKGAEVPFGQCSALRSDAPPFAAKLARRLVSTSLDNYYQPTVPPGTDRLRELYAHSAFYTWRLLRVTGWLYAALSLLVVGGAILFLYRLAAGEAMVAPRPVVLDTLLTVVIGVLGIRASVFSIGCFRSAGMARKVADALIEAPLPVERCLEELTYRYDFERNGGPAPPTAIYIILRGVLERDWIHRRRALSASSESTPSVTSA